ncbi:MAG: GAF domain-containing protein [Alphaproteobacteria bacterium]|nr:GAF domain-containing protein [Alphaproteobacteria bacterium]
MNDTDWLRTWIDDHQGVAGTIHRVRGDQLVLAASVNIPPPVLEATRFIPLGKGMAGLAWQRRAPVQTCNLQDDPTGDVRPGAKAVQAGAAVALPVFDAEGAVRAVLGVAFAYNGQIRADRLSRLEQTGATLPD